MEPCSSLVQSVGPCGDSISCSSGSGWSASRTLFGFDRLCLLMAGYGWWSGRTAVSEIEKLRNNWIDQAISGSLQAVLSIICGYTIVKLETTKPVKTIKHLPVLINISLCQLWELVFSVFKNNYTFCCTLSSNIQPATIMQLQSLDWAAAYGTQSGFSSCYGEAAWWIALLIREHDSWKFNYNF